MVTSPRHITGVGFSVIELLIGDDDKDDITAAREDIGVVWTPVVTARVVTGVEVAAIDGEGEGIALSHCMPINWGGHEHVQNVPALVWRVPPFWHVNVQGTA